MSVLLISQQSQLNASSVHNNGTTMSPPHDSSPKPTTALQPTVVLLHSPDPAWQHHPDDAPAGFVAHFDWLTRLPGTAAQTSPDDRVLMAFRMDEPMTGLCAKARHSSPIEVRALRLADHRQLYLDYEGPISGNRGVVHRVGTGIARWIRCEPTHCTLQLHFENLVCQVTGTCECHAQDNADPTGTWWKLVLTPGLRAQANGSAPRIGPQQTP